MTLIKQNKKEKEACCQAMVSDKGLIDFQLETQRVEETL